jgi:hypothetical protein
MLSRNADDSMDEDCVYLVPSDVLKHWRAERRAKETDDPASTRINKMDDDLSQTLQKPTNSTTAVSVHDLDKIVQEQLAKLLSARELKRVDNKPQPVIQNIIEHPPNKEAKLSFIDIPPSYRKKAQSLLHHFQKDSNFGWNRDQAVTYRGDTVEGSNIIHLLRDAVSKRSGPEQPPGFQLMRELSNKLNIPRSAFNNPAWKEPAPIPETKQTRSVKKRQRAIERWEIPK